MSSAPTIPKTMLAWQKHNPSSTPVRVEVPVPSVSEDGLLVKIHAAGVCHSDIAILNIPNIIEGAEDKLTLGHEGAGEIVAVGSAVKGFTVGEMIAVLSVPGCARAECAECSRGVPQICVSGERYGLANHGSFAPYIAIKSWSAVKLPKGVSASQGAVATDAVMTAYHAVVQKAKAKKEDTVVLYGLGGLGFNALQVLLHIGARVIAVDRRQEVLDEAVRFGVKQEDAVPADTADVAAWIAEKGIIVDKVIDFVGTHDSFKASQSLVRLAGTIVVVGLLEAELTLYSFVSLTKALNIFCSFGGTYSDVEAGLDLIAKGVIKPQIETGSLADFPKVLADLHEGKIKSRIVLLPEGL